MFGAHALDPWSPSAWPAGGLAVVSSTVGIVNLNRVPVALSVALRPDTASVGLNDAPADCETKAVTTNPLISLGLDAGELGEQARQVLAGYSGALVADR